MQYSFILFIFVLTSASYVRCSRKSARLHISGEHLSRMISHTESKVTFRCVALPNSAAVDWVLNGQRIGHGDPRFLIEHNKITIKLPARSSPESPYSDHEDSSYRSYFVERSESSHPFGVIQCRAKIGHLILLSEPVKLIVAVINDFVPQKNLTITVHEGNTAVIPCKPPHSVPIAFTEFIVNDTLINKSKGRYLLFGSGNLHIRNVKISDSGFYRCIAFNPFLNEKRNATRYVKLDILPAPRLSNEQIWNNANHASEKDSAPAESNLKFSMKPQPLTQVVMGANVTLECVIESIQPASIKWHRVEQPLPQHNQPLYGNLELFELKEEDSGEYVCEASLDENSLRIKTSTILDVQIIPRIMRKLENIKLAEGSELYLECNIKANPKPKISWFLNGEPLKSSENGTRIEDSGNSVLYNSDLSSSNFYQSKLRIRNVHYRDHAGIYQCFASNALGSASSSARIKFPDSRLNNQGTNSSSKGKKNKKRVQEIKLIPPSRPHVSRHDESSVIIRWSAPSNDGLPIQFFKIQYFELDQEDSDWQTVGEDLSPNTDFYFVPNLKAGSSYKFRIVAVYSNNDNRDGPSSERFTLLKNPPIQKPLSAPKIIHALPESPSSIRLSWIYDKDQSNSPTRGFIIFYRAVSYAGDYSLVAVPDSLSNYHSVTNLSSSTAYEFKMQSFNDAGVSEFSTIIQNKTDPDPDRAKTKEKGPIEENPIYPEINIVEDSEYKLYLIVALGVSLSLLARTLIPLASRAPFAS
ncbi:interference hedgehog-like [Brevipalpus obovatus]|uniref:interference hedgehog-like n=1 Tax=Brevipalpus obovatus TaxID=246614 RepID=UPI003D9F9B25